MKIFLLLNQAYPYGYALTKRFHLYAKGFIENGHFAKIVIPHPTEKINSVNKSTSGNFNNVPFKYTWNTTKRSKNFWSRRWHDFAGAIRTGLVILKEKPDILIVSTFSVYIYFYLKLISLVHPFKIIKEKNEIDFLRKEELSQGDIRKIRFTNRLFDGFIVINDLLLDHLNNTIVNKKPKIVVPILVEDFFTGKTLTKSEKTIVYTGTYLERKDGIISILKAFSYINSKYNYKLILTGSPEKSRDLPRIKKIIAEYHLEEDIIFTGYLSEQELHKLLLSAGILILAKPENRQNIYNFPTKIGEYLVSGRPVVSTRVGIIGKIMQDKTNIVFADYNIEDITHKIEYVINNPQIANEIGTNGRLYAIENFSYLNHGRRMIEYFYSLKIKT